MLYLFFFFLSEVHEVYRVMVIIFVIKQKPTASLSKNISHIDALVR